MRRGQEWEEKFTAEGFKLPPNPIFWDHSRELDFVTQGDARIENLKVWKYPATCSKENLCNGWWWVHYHFENWSWMLHRFFSLPKFALYSVQRNFMASKSFKVGFSMNIKMMLFHQFVTRLHFEFSLFCVCSLVPSLISSNVKYGLLLQNCKVKHSFPPFVFFIGKLFSGKLNQTLFRSCWKIKKRNGGKSLLDGSGFQLDETSMISSHQASWSPPTNSL